MKKLCLTSLLLATTAFAAHAADMAPVKASPLVTPSYSWSGLYVGANAGWVGSSNDTITNSGIDTGKGGLGSALNGGGIPGTISESYNGFIGGVQAGYNWQTGMFVYGLEADFDGSSAKSSSTRSITAPGFVPITTNASRELDWLSTIRGRAGIAAGPLLFYGTGGLAFGETKLGIGAVAPQGSPPLNASNTTTNVSTGWTVGAGAEWQFASNWSARLEYLYVDLGDINSTIGYAYGKNTSLLTASAHDSENIVRIGVNYKLLP